MKQTHQQEKTIPDNKRKVLRRQILTYLGSDVLNVELTYKQIDLAIDLGYEMYLNKKGQLFDLCLGHSMIMLGFIRSKFGDFSMPGVSLEGLKENGKHLVKVGNFLLGR